MCQCSLPAVFKSIGIYPAAPWLVSSLASIVELVEFVGLFKLFNQVIWINFLIDIFRIRFLLFFEDQLVSSWKAAISVVRVVLMSEFLPWPNFAKVSNKLPWLLGSFGVLRVSTPANRIVLSVASSDIPWWCDSMWQSSLSNHSSSAERGWNWLEPGSCMASVDIRCPKLRTFRWTSSSYCCSISKSTSRTSRSSRFSASSHSR